MAQWNQALDPFRALVHTFLVRFFENVITPGLDDLKGVFFWLVAALAMPGMFIPAIVSSHWEFVAISKGPLALREASLAEKVFYLGFAMAASGLLTMAVRNSLLPERRDALILGALPVGSSTVVAAKLTALVAYVLVVALSMHAIGALFFGTMLAAKAGTLFAIRGIFAHVLAASAASVTAALIVVAAQGAVLACAGPRGFARFSGVLHACLVGLIAVGLASLPVITSSVVQTVRGGGPRMRPWILLTPPAWFLGLYEWLLGTSDPVLIGLARNAALALLCTVVVIVASYPVIYRRQMSCAIEDGRRAGWHSMSQVARGLLIRAAGKQPHALAAADFYTATVARTDRHRLVLAGASGLAIAWGMIGITSLDPSVNPDTAWLSLPLCAMVFLIAGLQAAASLPGDVRASWLFEVHEPARVHARRALEGTMVLLGVLPPTLFPVPLYWWFWGPLVALIHTAVSLAVGLILVELLIWHAEGMPCGRPWYVARANLGRRWPIYAGAFVIVAVGVPNLELWLLAHTWFAVAFMPLLSLMAAVVRHASATHVIEPDGEVDPVAGILRLN